MSVYTQEQSITSPRSHDMGENGVRGQKSVYSPADSQTTLQKCNVANSDPCDNNGSESSGPVSSRTRRKTAWTTEEAGSCSSGVNEAAGNKVFVSADVHHADKSISHGDDQSTSYRQRHTDQQDGALNSISLIGLRTLHCFGALTKQCLHVDYICGHILTVRRAPKKLYT